MTPTFDTDTVFDTATYMRFYGPVLTPEASDRQVGQLLDLLQPASPLRILDLPCGFGRFANRLAARGHQVTGIDLMPGFLDLARSEAQALGVAADYRQGDMTRLDQVEGYDVVLNLFTSFGYHDDAVCADILRRMARALKPGGRLVLETLHISGLLRRFQPASVRRVEADRIIDENAYDAVTGRLLTRRTTLVAGQRTESDYFVRLFTPPEFTALCQAAGLTIERFCDGFTGKPLTMDSYRLLFIARKEGGACGS